MLAVSAPEHGAVGEKSAVFRIQVFLRYAQGDDQIVEFPAFEDFFRLEVLHGQIGGRKSSRIAGRFLSGTDAEYENDK